ncbi:hypothetical protein Neosp_001129 [[Neocosmospora] mangrovei]
MASKATSNIDAPLASIDFPGPYAATFYFNNDLAEEPDYLLSSDGGYLTDDSDTSGEEGEDLPPESYMSEFPAVEGNPWPALSPSSTPSLTSSMQTQISSSDYQHSPKDQTDNSELSFTNVGSASPEIEVNTDGYVPFVEPSEGIVNDGTNQTFEASKAQSTIEKHSPAHFINFVDWKNPVPFDEFAKFSPQHRSEVRAIHWDSRLWFTSKFERGTPEYYEELARWRAARLRNIAGVPMDQKQADEIGYIMFRVSEIAATRDKERRRRERQATGPKQENASVEF